MAQPSIDSVEVPPASRLRLLGLSRRETEVALLAAHGLLLRDVASHIQVAPGTVKALLARARRKLGCASVRDLTIVLLREALVRPDELPDPRIHPAGS